MKCLPLPHPKHFVFGKTIYRTSIMAAHRHFIVSFDYYMIFITALFLTPFIVVCCESGCSKCFQIFRLLTFYTCFTLLAFSILYYSTVEQRTLIISHESMNLYHIYSRRISDVRKNCINLGPPFG